MATTNNMMALVGLRRFIKKQIRKGTRTPFEYVVLATMGILVAAILKYPNRAIFTIARPDLKEKTATAYPIVGNMPQMLRNSKDSLGSMNTAFRHFGAYFSLSVPIFGRLIAVNTPEHYEHIMKSMFFEVRHLFLPSEDLDHVQSLIFFFVFLTISQLQQLHQRQDLPR